MSKREINMLLFLLVLGIAAAVYFLVYKPLNEEVISMQSKKNTSQATYEAGMARIGQLAELTEQLDEAKEIVVAIAEEFHSGWEQEEYIVKLDKLAEGSGIIFRSVSYGGESAVDVPVPEGDAGEDVPEGVTGKVTYSVQFETSYQQLLSLLHQLERNKKHIVCNQISLSPVGETQVETLSGERAVQPAAPADEEADDSDPAQEEQEEEEVEIEQIIAAARDNDGEDMVSCSMTMGFYYFNGMEEATRDTDYVNILEEEPLTTTGDTSPFRRVVTRQ